jgi:hypothetical protein
VGNQIGALWILEETDTVAARAFLLVRLQGGAGAGGATWFEIGAGGSGFVDTFVTDSGNAVPAANIINIIGGTSTGGVATNMNTRGSGNTVFVNLNNSIFQPDTNSTGTQGMYSLGGATFMHNFGTQNTWLGEEAGNLTLTTGQDNVGLGYHAAEGITTGNDNIAIGSNALNANDTGTSNIAIGTNAGLLLTGGSGANVIIGKNAFPAAVSAGGNVIIGENAALVSDSDSNVIIGYNALAMDTGSSANTIVGFRAMQLAVNNNQSIVAIGHRAFENLDGGTQSVAIGANALGSATTGHNGSVAVGWHALFGITSQATTEANTGVGHQVFEGTVTGLRNCGLGYRAAAGLIGASSDNIAIGSNALNSAGATANNLIAIGSNALDGVSGSTNLIAIGSNALTTTPGNLCIAIGTDSQRDNNAGENNTTLGHAAMKFCVGSSSNVIIGTANWDIGVGNASANGNIVLGLGSLRNNVSGNDNFCAGNSSLINSTAGAFNVAILESSLNLCTGSGNVAIGQQSLLNVVAANSNTALGNLTGTALTGTDSNNILIGGSVAGVVGDNNTTRIGATGTMTRCFIAGIRGRTTGVADAVAVLIDSAHQLGTVSSSARFKDNIQDMGDASSPLMKLRPVTFHYKEDEEKRLQYGLIAEEVEEVMPRLVAYDEHGEVYTVRYNELPAILLNEIQKLEKRISALESRPCACSH